MTSFDFSHWHSSTPTPPAAAGTSTVCPGCTRVQRSTSDSTVQAFSHSAAACSSDTLSGSFTSGRASITRWVA